MGKLRAFLGLGTSKAERLQILRDRLEKSERILDWMAFNHRATYDHVTTHLYDEIHYRPGVVALEMRKTQMIRDQFERECG